MPRSELPQLEHPDARRSVEERLHAVGLVLATSAYSDHYGLRLSPEACAEPGFDAASNVGLASDACALLVVLWSRLVLQKRAATDTRETPGEASLFAEERAKAAAAYVPQVRVETLLREFGHVFPNRTRLVSLLTQLRRLGFVRGTTEVVEPGPFLELGLDAERLVTYIRREVLAGLVAGGVPGAAPQVPEDETELELLRLLADFGRPVSRGELARASGRLSPHRVSRALKSLVQRGRIASEGTRGNARYALVAPSGDAPEAEP